MELAVLLRKGPHDGTNTNPTTRIRYALKCDTFSVQITKTPIQIPIPQQSPEIVDLGIFRPSISIGGLVDTIGQDSANTAVGFENMEFISHTRGYWSGVSTFVNKTHAYYIPYKNALEETVYKWISTADAELELEIGDATYPRYNTAPIQNSNNSSTLTGSVSETGGGVYSVALQQARFQVDPATEDRWTFQMQFVCESRADVTFE